MKKQTIHASLNVIPDDPEGSTYRFVVVSALRARQLQGGARSVLLPVSMKATTAAMQEVRRGLIPWSDTRTGPEEALASRGALEPDVTS